MTYYNKSLLILWHELHQCKQVIDYMHQFWEFFLQLKNHYFQNKTPQTRKYMESIFYSHGIEEGTKHPSFQSQLWEMTHKMFSIHRNKDSTFKKSTLGFIPTPIAYTWKLQGLSERKKKGIFERENLLHTWMQWIYQLYKHPLKNQKEQKDKPIIYDAKYWVARSKASPHCTKHTFQVPWSASKWVLSLTLWWQYLLQILVSTNTLNSQATSTH